MTEPVLRVSAHAKVNLRLRVLGREASGYHHLETLYLRLALHDTVEIELDGTSSGITLDVAGPEAGGVPTDSRNLCWRAAEAFFRRDEELNGTDASGGADDDRDRRADAGRDDGAVAIRLEKRVPAGAGLGGGSADAAAVLRGLNELGGRPLSDDELFRVACELGSDVPFALSGAPFALGWGRGRRLMPLAPPPERPILVVCPDRRIDTAEAYGWLAEDRAAGDPVGTEAGSGEAEDAGAYHPSAGAAPAVAPLPPAGELRDWSTLAGLTANDFEVPVFRRHPRLADFRRDLLEAGADIALLSGSGSALFAVFADASVRDRAIEVLRADDLRMIATRAPDRESG